LVRPEHDQRRFACPSAGRDTESALYGLTGALESGALDQGGELGGEILDERLDAGHRSAPWHTAIELDYANEESFYCRSKVAAGGERLEIPAAAANVRIAIASTRNFMRSLHFSGRRPEAHALARWTSVRSVTRHPTPDRAEA